MEDTLWEMKKFRLIKSTEVLILVLMEDTLWAMEKYITVYGLVTS